VVDALVVRQWLSNWNKVSFNGVTRRRPEPHFYLLRLTAADLKALSGVRHRTTELRLRGDKDLGIQRRHEKSRSDEISRFVQDGYPWSELSNAKRRSSRFDDLRMPGWLPTAIVVNVLKSGDKRHGLEVATADLISIQSGNNGLAAFHLPKGFSGASWKPAKLHPIEVVDGQHRLWAFEDFRPADTFELPVVAFHGLDVSWQAYLFWTINIRPKRINASLAFDLYPLLRAEGWLEKFEGHSIYRQTRAQELTESLWAHPDSPWHRRINMLGEPGMKASMVTQAAWIRSLMATYVRVWEGRGVTIGGLFGAPVGKDKEVLPWTRAQQAAFLIVMGQSLRDATKASQAEWAKTIRRQRPVTLFEEKDDPAFLGPTTLLNTDQGIRGILSVTNDLCYVMAPSLRLADWALSLATDPTDINGTSTAMASLKKQPAFGFLSSIAAALATYDWRTSAAPGLSEEQRIAKAALRGSGGYRELRLQLLRHLSREKGGVGDAAKRVVSKVGHTA
jgi:DGQHR domain-containing protein